MGTLLIELAERPTESDKRTSHTQGSYAILNI